MDKVIELLREIEGKKEYGEILIKYEGGKVVVCKKTVSIKT